MASIISTTATPFLRRLRRNRGFQRVIPALYARKGLGRGTLRYNANNNYATHLMLRCCGLTTESSSEDSTTTDNTNTELVYESPLSNVVTRLRAVSLSTGFFGSVGLPLVMAIKGEVPSAGYLGLAMAFLSGTLGSTAAIHFVFSPYVYTIERIPIRQCHYKKAKDDDDNEDADAPSTPVSDLIEPSQLSKDFLLKAKSRGLFLREIETVFDPCTDMTLYNGLRPLCNMEIKGRNLYVHPEYVYDDEMRRQLKVDESAAAPVEQKNPDDDFI